MLFSTVTLRHRLSFILFHRFPRGKKQQSGVRRNSSKALVYADPAVLDARQEVLEPDGSILIVQHLRICYEGREISKFSGSCKLLRRGVGKDEPGLMTGHRGTSRRTVGRADVPLEIMNSTFCFGPINDGPLLRTTCIICTNINQTQ